MDLKDELRELFRNTGFDSDMIEEVFEQTGLGDKSLGDLDTGNCLTILKYIAEAETIQGEDVTDLRSNIKAILLRCSSEIERVEKILATALMQMWFVGDIKALDDPDTLKELDTTYEGIVDILERFDKLMESKCESFDLEQVVIAHVQKIISG